MSNMSNYIENVAIVGVGGEVGKYIASELLATGRHVVTAITRAESTSAVPSRFKKAIINYDDHSSIVSALKGQDCLVITMSLKAPPDSSEKLIRAAAEAGVPWILPNEWGLDHNDLSVAEDTMVGLSVLKYRSLITSLGMASYIGVTCGIWYEWSLSINWACGFDIANKHVTFYDDGNTDINTSTLPQCGRGVAKLLSLPEKADDGPSLEDFKNSLLYISSFRVSQKDMFTSILKVTGDEESDWTIDYQDVKKRYQEGVKRLQGGDRVGLGILLYSRLYYPDDTGNFEKRKGLHNDLLGLPKEDMDEFTKIAIQKPATSPF